MGRTNESVDERLRQFVDAGFSPEGAAAIYQIDIIMQRVRRGLARREFVAEILAAIDPSMELAHLDVMSVISHWKYEAAADSGSEVTVGLVAEKLGVDPSRASRLVAEIVDKGYARRVASQADARRICVEPTEKGWALSGEFRRRKWDMLAQGLKGWSNEELVLFADLLDRFSYWDKGGIEARPKASGG